MATARIPLTRGMEATVSEEDYPLVSSRGKWYAMHNKKKNQWYAVREDSVPGSPGASVMVYMHRVILSDLLVEEELIVDHVDGDGLNNTRGNIRVATYSQNNVNKPKQKNNVTGYKGVSVRKSAVKNPYAARIKNNGVVHRSYHPSAEEAARAYDDMAVLFYGNFAYTNFNRER